MPMFCFCEKLTGANNLGRAARWCDGLLLSALFFVSPVCRTQAGVAYADPDGGWSYIFQGDQDTAGDAGSGFTSLDGTWSHDNGADEWDGSKLGGDIGATNRPGGLMTLTESGITFLRIQDTGDPRDYQTGFEFEDPGSNRKLFLMHDLTTNAPSSMLDAGVTLSFRARIPTSGTIDPLYRDSETAIVPYPAAGDGYLNSNSGEGNITLRQADGGSIAFSLTLTNDIAQKAGTPANVAGLTMNSLNGPNISTDVDFGQGSNNVLPVKPTDWHEFWIAIQKDPANQGTHQAVVFADGSLDPKVFKLTAGIASEMDFANYLALGTPATAQNGAIDLDFVAFKAGAIPPKGGQLPNPPPPANTNLVLSMPTLNGTDIQFSFDAENGLTYQVQFTESLLQPVWAELKTVTPTANGPVSVTDSIQLSRQRFYRVVVL